MYNMVKLQCPVHSKMRAFTRLFFVGLLGITIGAILPDIDHLLPPFHRSWGHDPILPLCLLGLLLLVVAAAHIRRRSQAGILRPEC